MLKTVMIICMMQLICASLFAQEERKIIRNGNDLFENNDFEKAEVEYRKALETKDDSYEAAFNLGDALYKQKKYEEALQQFANLAEKETDKQRLGELYHNIGNTFLAMNKLDESIEAYKKSLLNRPTSQETKYNLEFARQQQQQNQNQQNQNNQNQQNQDKQNQDKNQQDQQNQNQDQQNQDKNKQDQQNQNKDQNQNDQNQQNQDKQNQDQQNQDKNKQDQNKQDQQKDQQQGKEQQGEGQQQEGKISKEDANRLLEALENDEKKTQEKVQKQKAEEQKSKKMKIEKNW